MSQVRVKICGLTSVEAVENAARSGADAIGIVFYPSSSRFVEDLSLARAMCLAAGPFVTTVGLFVDAEVEFIERVLDAVPLGMLQFHGTEPEPDCVRYRRPYIKAFRMKPGLQLEATVGQYESATGVLLDAYIAGVPGGTGTSFDWQKVPADLSKPVILAGGLDVNNIDSAVKQVKPWAVDVSGGVEDKPGVKSASLVKKFITLAKNSNIPSNIGE